MMIIYDALTILISNILHQLVAGWRRFVFAKARGSEFSLSMSGATNILILHQLMLVLGGGGAVVIITLGTT